MHEVRRDRPGERPPLVVRLAHQADVPETQVAQAAVDELRGCARRARAEVPGLDQRDGEARACGVRRRRGTDHAAADHEQVECRPPERLARSGTPLARGEPRYDHRGFVHARRPAGSTTSTRANGALPGRSSRAATMPSSGETSRISAP